MTLLLRRVPSGDIRVADRQIQVESFGYQWRNALNVFCACVMSSCSIAFGMSLCENAIEVWLVMLTYNYVLVASDTNS